MTNINRLEQLGLTTVANTLKAELSVRQKLAIAYEHYRYLTPSKVDAFNVKLMAETRVDEGANQWGQIYSYKRTALTNLRDYAKVPPNSVLDALETAQGRGCFDQYQVMTIESHKVVPDPILFGQVTGCDDLFFISQWDDDIKIEDILKDHEGWAFLDKGAK